MTSIFEDDRKFFATLVCEVSRAINKKLSAEIAAQDVYSLLCRKAKELGQNPTSEVFIKSPIECALERRPQGNVWLVSWEAGPYEWAIAASMQNHDKLVEPYYSFDLCFDPKEWE